VRTYLYVDGENFTIRAQKLSEELATKPEMATKLRGQLREHARDTHLDAHQLSINTWAPKPSRAAHEFADPFTKTISRKGTTHVVDELYWDSLGLWLAFYAALPDATPEETRARLLFDRATYFGSASGTDGITAQTQALHSLGFVSHVFQRSKPDDFVKRAKDDGVTVISRPKPLDLLLATQVLEDTWSNNFDRCVFVGGDEDYVPLLEAVRRRGKQVWVVAFDRYLSAKSRLRLLSDRWIPYDPVIALRPLPPS
jgi:uncharacterized LabA/DUF88 family protein